METKRLIMALPIYKNGNIVDYSDEGEAVLQVQSNLQAEYLLNQLPPQQKKVVKLKMEGYKGKEIALKCGIKISTVYSYKKLAKAKLKATLEKMAQ